MIRSILVFTIIFFSLFLLSFSLHEFVIENQQINLPFSLKKVYLFHLGFSLLICVNFLIFSTVNKIFEQLGFIYLGTIVLKLILFSIIFNNPLFSEEGLSFQARLSLFIPMIVFLLTEAILVAKILKKKQ
ncbi:DUF6168 family protein [Polaribacter sp. Z022]|uniref:DUF6168 family protein n=1 Tax=Polaribacter sp. Z022 TaxID=2927125 RepID=UPI002021B9AC|nr:DUF6168 family protein [Polaribacter sp. Z022]MCL7752372.1 DUF6168 family protein [Polaribacter sp. Z022]